MIAEAAARAIGAPLVGAHRVAGGDINDAWLVELADGRRAFVKSRAGALPGEYGTEAAGLRWLADVDGGPPVPTVLAVSDVNAGSGGDPGGRPALTALSAVNAGSRGDPGGRPALPFLALEWIDEGRLDAAGEEALGRGLAHLHAAGAPAFGGAPPGAPFEGLRLGRVELPAATATDWPAFYAEHRIAPLLGAAADRGALPPRGAQEIEALIGRLPELAGPPEPPARLHGDLWSGNVLAAAGGRPFLIDPAAYGGHREVDLAMLRLFGAPSRRTLAAYEEVAPLAEGHERRVPLWQLFPLLVHAVLFGGSYGASAVRAATQAAA